MRFNFEILLYFLLSQGIKRLYRIVPVSTVKLHLFPFDDQLLTLRTWVWYGQMHVSYMIFLRAIYLATDGSRFINWLFILEFIDFFDYVLRYNTELFFFGTFGLEYDDLKLITIGIICFHYFRSRNR